jgi:predicted dehydrogenase
MPTSRRTLLKGLTGITCSIAASRLLASQAGGSTAAPVARLKVGQIGVGHAHASKLAAYLESADFEVVGIAEPNQELKTAAMKIAPYRDVPWMSVEQLLNVTGLDVVLVETHVRDALRTAQTCVAAGKHIHLDKPAGDSLPAYAQLLQQAEQQNLMVQMGYMYRYNPAILLLREFLSKGWLGEIFEVHTVMSKVVDAAARKQLAEFPGGMMFELGCHIIDLVVGVLGKPEKIDAYAKHSSPLDDSLVDNMLAVFEYPQAMATVKTSALEVDGFARRHFVVCGTGGTFHIQPLDQPIARIALSEARGTYKTATQEITFPKFERYRADAADMAQVIRGEKAADYSYAHDLAVQTAVLQASNSKLD